MTPITYGGHISQNIIKGPKRIVNSPEYKKDSNDNECVNNNYHKNKIEKYHKFVFSWGKIILVSQITHILFQKSN